MRDQTAARAVTILHISDTQFGEHHAFSPGVESLASHLIVDLRWLIERRAVPAVDLICVTGDIAEKGLRSEYDQARAFIDELCGFTKLDYDRVVVVPGNHDVNRGLSAAYFGDCAGDEQKPREPYTRKWRPYQRFVAALHGEAAFTEEQPYRLHRFDDLRLAVAALNSTMRESHLKDDHYGWCGTEQLRWFEDRLRDAPGNLARIGLVHHNARRKATVDEENLKDEDALTEILGPHLDLLLHGHTHQGKEDRLSGSGATLVLATGAAAVTPQWRPREVPNQYQILELRPGGGLRRSGRQWAGTKWIADPRVSGHDDWQVDLPFDPPGWRAYRPAPGRRGKGRARGAAGPADPFTREGTWEDSLREDGPGRERDFVEQVEYVTRRDLGENALIDRRNTGHPPLEYLLAIRPAAPDRCVGVLDRALDATELDRFDEHVFAPLRERGGIDLVLVHRGPDDPALRAQAKRRHGISVKTWAEYNDLLEPSAYAAWLRDELASDDRLYPQELYLDQCFRDIDRWGKAGRDIRENLLNEVFDAMLDDESRFVLLLGDAGYGKSFLVRRLAYQMLGNDRIGVTPIVIYLRDRDKRQSIDEMVSSVFLPSRASFNVDRFQHSLAAGSLALLIDGYDEFAVRVGFLNAAAQLNTFVTALQGKAKILLTTRPNHFRGSDEVTSKLFDSLVTVHQGRVYQLEPFDERQQLAFLTRWFELRHGNGAGSAVGNEAGDTAARWMDALGRVDNLPELARTPRMLSFMVEDLTLDEINAAAGQGTVTAADLYQTLIDRWLRVEESKIEHGDERTVPAPERQRLLEELALLLWRAGERDVTELALQQVARTLDLPKHDMTLDAAAQMLGGRTLLRVDQSRWRFAHQSVWEFLLARRLAATLRDGRRDADDVLGEAELTGLTIRFLRDLAPADAAAWAARVAGERP